MTGSAAPPAWLVRAGRHGQDEAAALQEGLAIIGFDELGDQSRAKDAHEILSAVRVALPGSSEAKLRNVAAQHAAFVLKMKKGDTVVLPLKTRAGRVAVGRVTGPYQYRDIAGQPRHVRPVDWVRPNVARSDFQQDLLYSLGAFMTVCSIKRNAAAARLAEILEGRKDPGPPPESGEVTRRKDVTEEVAAEEVPADIGELAHDQIVARIEGRFRGHDMARLVDAILKAEGYYTHLSPAGPDGGVDILAGRGTLGLDSPRLCVQVKSSSSPADVSVLRALQGSMQTFKAEQGLLVSWGGVTSSVRQEARQNFFTVRVWDAGDLVEALYRAYDRLPEEIQTDLPLKRVWTLVMDEAEE